MYINGNEGAEEAAQKPLLTFVNRKVTYEIFFDVIIKTKEEMGQKRILGENVILRAVK